MVTRNFEVELRDYVNGAKMYETIMSREHTFQTKGLEGSNNLYNQLRSMKKRAQELNDENHKIKRKLEENQKELRTAHKKNVEFKNTIKKNDDKISKYDKLKKEHVNLKKHLDKLEVELIDWKNSDTRKNLNNNNTLNQSHVDPHQHRHGDPHHQGHGESFQHRHVDAHQLKHVDSRHNRPHSQDPKFNPRTMDAATHLNSYDKTVYDKLKEKYDRMVKDKNGRINDLQYSKNELERRLEVHKEQHMHHDPHFGRGSHQNRNESHHRNDPHHDEVNKSSMTQSFYHDDKKKLLDNGVDVLAAMMQNKSTVYEKKVVEKKSHKLENELRTKEHLLNNYKTKIYDLEKTMQVSHTLDHKIVELEKNLAEKHRRIEVLERALEVKDQDVERKNRTMDQHSQTITE